MFKQRHVPGNFINCMFGNGTDMNFDMNFDDRQLLGQCIRHYQQYFAEKLSQSDVTATERAELVQAAGVLCANLYHFGQAYHR